MEELETEKRILGSKLLNLVSEFMSMNGVSPDIHIWVESPTMMRIGSRNLSGESSLMCDIMIDSDEDEDDE